ncbi:hypothetical protein DH2020_010882 [Rehmannia glutinosa]|uniref:GTD-binding domain-containing protein n=1 Tax=Rehmannia glutinosa TaxID=99300 RepID=A0ABR0XBU9_REHGL
MADYNIPMSQSEISALKDTLCAQQKLLQKLYNELDAEREASATAASEALSVILRLQGEKAAVKMEAEQYKRLAEEKMCHAEESFAIIEDIIYQKEMEVAALDYQVQAYRYKLLSMGCADPGGGENKFPENLLQRNESLSGDTSLSRRNSAPVLLKYKKAMIERESSLSPEMDLVSKSVEELTGGEINDVASDSDKKTDNNNSTNGGIVSYGEQIRKLEIRVKEIAGANYTSSRNEIRSPSSLSSRLSVGNLSYLSNSGNLQPEGRSPSPQLSIGVVNEIDQMKYPRSPSPLLSISNQYDPNKVVVLNGAEQTKHREAVYDPCSPSVHDVFEVPQVDEYCSSYESSTKDKKKESRDLVHPEAVKLSDKDQPDWLKKLLQSTHNGKNVCKPSDVAAIDRALVQPTTSVGESRPNLNQLNANSRISEIETRADESANREEELKLLKEIKEQLNVLHDEVRSQKVTKSSVREKPSLCPLPEKVEQHFKFRKPGGS